MTGELSIPLGTAITVIGGVAGYMLAAFRARSDLRSSVFMRIEDVKGGLEQKVEAAADTMRAEFRLRDERMTQQAERANKQWDAIRDKEMIAQQTYATKEDVAALGRKFDTFAQQQHEFHTRLMSMLRGLGGPNSKDDTG